MLCVPQNQGISRYYKINIFIVTKSGGKPAVLDPQSPAGKAFMMMAAKVVTQVDKRNMEMPATQPVKMER